MSASDHVNRTLFHGTGHTFSEGETIDPQEKSKNGNMMGLMFDDYKPTVYMTSNMHKAKRFAGTEARDKGLLFSQVYEVEDNPDIKFVPEELSKIGYDEQTTGQHWAKDTYYSRGSVKPKKIAAWVVNPDIEYF